MHRCSATGRFLPNWIFDPFDPRGWPEPLPFRTIWLKPDAGIFCVVDVEDYDWAMQWLWQATPNSTGNKFYATRMTRMEGNRAKQTKIYLHKEILARKGQTPPSRRHVIGDHLDGESLNNRRKNLRWATPSQNGKNRYGYFVKQRELFEEA